MKIATVKEMREIDKAALDEYGIPEILLMENAGRETCQAALDLFDGLADKKICVLAGSGILRCTWILRCCPWNWIGIGINSW